MLSHALATLPTKRKTSKIFLPIVERSDCHSVDDPSATMRHGPFAIMWDGPYAKMLYGTGAKVWYGPGAKNRYCHGAKIGIVMVP